MKTGPAEGAADPVKGAADEEPPTVLLGALKVKVPNGETLVLQTTFDTGSDTDARFLLTLHMKFWSSAWAFFSHIAR